MVFSSIFFLFCFLPIVLGVYYFARDEYRNYVLLLASLFFYFCGEGLNIWIMLTVIAIDYVSGILIDRMDSHVKRKIVLVGAVMCNLGLLFYFKYFDFAILNINRFFHLNLPVKGIALPIGISFFVFQGLSYVIDLYRTIESKIISGGW